MNTKKIEAAKNLMSKLGAIAHPQAFPRQAGAAEMMLNAIEYDRLLRSLNAIPVEIVRRAESEMYQQDVRVIQQFDPAIIGNDVEHAETEDDL